MTVLRLVLWLTCGLVTVAIFYRRFLAPPLHLFLRFVFDYGVLYCLVIGYERSVLVLERIAMVTDPY